MKYPVCYPFCWIMWCLLILWSPKWCPTVISLCWCDVLFVDLLMLILQCCTFLDSPAQEDPEGETLQGGNGREVTTWDDTLRKSTLEYQHQSYNILTWNCHSFVANCLNRLKFQAGNWNVVSLAVLIFMKGRFVSRLAILQTYLPFVIVLGLGLVFGGGAFLTYLFIFICVLVGWFLLGTYCCKNLIHV